MAVSGCYFNFPYLKYFLLTIWNKVSNISYKYLKVIVFADFQKFWKDFEKIAESVIFSFVIQTLQ